MNRLPIYMYEVFVNGLDAVVVCYVIFQFHRSMKRYLYEREMLAADNPVRFCNIRREYYIAAYLAAVLLHIALRFVQGTDSLTMPVCLWLIGVLAGYFLHYKTKWQLLYNAILVAGLIILSMFTSILVNTLFRVFPAALMGPELSAIVFVFMTEILFVCLARMLIGIGMRQIPKNEERKNWFISIAVLTGSLLFILAFFNMTGIYLLLYDEGMILAAILLIMLLLLNMFLSDLLQVFRKNQELREELVSYQQQARLQYQYYQNLEEKYQNSRKLIHDIRNHLHAVESLYHIEESEAGSRYARDIHGKLNLLGQQYYTDNKMLNIILNDMAEKARSHKIELKLIIKAVDLEGIRDIDITTIFANLSDNAMTAAAAVENDRYIQLKLEQFHDFIIVNMKNSCRPVNRYESKGRRQGIGLKNVQSVLERYDGTMDIRRTDTTFQVHIVIPVANNFQT